MLLNDYHWREAREIARRCELIRAKPVVCVLAYYAIGILNAILDGVSIVLLVDLVTGRIDLNSSAPVIDLVKQTLAMLSWPQTFTAIYFLVAALFGLRLVLQFAITLTEGVLEAKLRRTIQNGGFARVMAGDWTFLRDIRVGERVGAITEEASKVAIYFTSLIRAIYFFLTTAVLLIVAIAMSAEVTVLFIVAGLPVLLLLKYCFRKQAETVERLVVERQGLYASVTERLHGLFQIKVEGNPDRHTRIGLQNQDRMTEFEIRWWLYRAYISAFNLLIPAIVLVAFYLWSVWKSTPLQDAIYILASVGVIGSRVSNQVNQLIANVGNVSGFSGSILPVYNLFTIPVEPPKQRIAEKIHRVDLKEVSYWYGQNHCIQTISFRTHLGKPTVIMGPSGSGKTTLANLIAGVYRPASGTITYQDISSRDYDSREFRPKAGYVPQDIHLFRGTVRDNLIIYPDSGVGDDALWQCLRHAGAEGFVQKLGGLDAAITEAGRSLSGGEKRRLGIARVLTANPHILILDEVTAGLDEARKKELIATIKELAESLIVIVITHDPDMADQGAVDIVSLSQAVLA